MGNQDHILITGGAGFVGTNIALSYLSEGRSVHLFDNLSRAGVGANVEHLQSAFGHSVQFTQGDVRDRNEVARAVSTAACVYHLAAQVAVTTSLTDPVGDLEANLLGTVNVLEEVRSSRSKPPILFTSTNKVYGKLENVALERSSSRWQPQDIRQASEGISEEQSLAFLSPYGCSKGGADQYVLDYAHSFGITATVFRMSCIYGPFQLGSEDQGWVAHFLRQSLKGEPVTIFGDGYQVRDLLFVEDLVRAMRRAFRCMKVACGQAFNIGGGYENSVTLNDVLSLIEKLMGDTVEIEYERERLADQKWYIANTRKAERLLGWRPETTVPSGLQRLLQWYRTHPELTKSTRQEAQYA
jgi:CDP-paratose 2-epimerase